MPLRGFITTSSNQRSSSSSLLVQHIDERWIETAVTGGLGLAGFWSTLAATTWAQRCVGISTGSLRPIPSIAGLMSVCLAATLSHQVAESAQYYFANHNRWHHQHKNNFWQGVPFPVPDRSKRIGRIGNVSITMKMIQV